MVYADKDTLWINDEEMIVVDSPGNTMEHIAWSEARCLNADYNYVNNYPVNRVSESVTVYEVTKYSQH